MDLNYVLIGMRIRRFREKSGLSQEELADRINATERHIRNIEAGRSGLSISLLVSLANTFDVTVDDLLADSLTCSNDSLRTEVFNLLSDCTPTETEILMDMLKHMKTLLSKYGI